MKNLLKLKLFVALVALFTAFGAVDAAAQKRTVRKKPVIRKATTVRKPVVTTLAVRYYTVSSGQVLRVRMNSTLNSKTARVGDTFTVTVTEPVYAETGTLVIPVGSTLTGRVDSAQAAQKGGKPGTIDVSFIRLRTPNGTSRAINGSLTDLHSDDAKSDPEGRASGDKMKHRKIIFIGGGGAGGAILGGAIGGGKGAVIGGILGAGAGLLGERLTKGEEAEVRSGTEFSVYLNQAITLPRFAESNL
jgi:hypothetical protein